jgi:hypothetical protein
MLFDVQNCRELRLQHIPSRQQTLTKNITRGHEICHEIMVTGITISGFSSKECKSSLFPIHNPNTFLF